MVNFHMTDALSSVNHGERWVPLTGVQSGKLWVLADLLHEPGRSSGDVLDDLLEITQDPAWNHKSPSPIPGGSDSTADLEVYDSDKIPEMVEVMQQSTVLEVTTEEDEQEVSNMERIHSFVCHTTTNLDPNYIEMTIPDATTQRSGNPAVIENSFAEDILEALESQEVDTKLIPAKSNERIADMEICLSTGFDHQNLSFQGDNIEALRKPDKDQEILVNTISVTAREETREMKPEPSVQDGEQKEEEGLQLETHLSTGYILQRKWNQRK